MLSWIQLAATLTLLRIARDYTSMTDTLIILGAVALSLALAKTFDWIDGKR